METLQFRRDKYKLILFYKIINGLEPQYMLDLIQSYFQAENAYSVRSNYLFYCLPLYRTIYYNSFVPSSGKLWTNHHAKTKLSSILSIFKSKRKKQNIPKANNKHFSLGNRKENIILHQLGNKDSYLNAYLFN